MTRQRAKSSSQTLQHTSYGLPGLPLLATCPRVGVQTAGAGYLQATSRTREVDEDSDDEEDE